MKIECYDGVTRTFLHAPGPNEPSSCRECGYEFHVDYADPLLMEPIFATHYCIKAETRDEVGIIPKKKTLRFPTDGEMEKDLEDAGIIEKRTPQETQEILFKEEDETKIDLGFATVTTDFNNDPTNPKDPWVQKVIQDITGMSAKSLAHNIITNSEHGFGEETGELVIGGSQGTTIKIKVEISPNKA